MDSQKVHCQFSSDYFSGYNVEIDLSKIKSLDQIVNICRDSLLSVLRKHNFEILIERAHKSKFHIHQPTCLEQAKANPLEVIWICDHKEE